MRATFGDTVPLPRGRIEATLDTTAPKGTDSDFEKVLNATGLDPSLFKLPTIGQAAASLRAYTPGYDLSSSVPIERVGGLEFEANFEIPGVVDNADFLFRMSPPVAGHGGTYLPFNAKASASEISLGGFTIKNAIIELTSDAAGLRVAVAGTTELLGAMFTVEGELDSLFRGDLTLTLETGETLAGAFGGLSGNGSLTLQLNGPTSGSVYFDGSLSNVPGTGGSLSLSGYIQSSGDFS